MLRLVLGRGAAAALNSLREPLFRTTRCPPPPPLTSTPTNPRYYGTTVSDAAPRQQQQLSMQMIHYALGHARSQKSAESYAQALLILEQGLANLQAGGSDADNNAVGRFLLAMSTLLYERGELNDAMEKLRMVSTLGHTSLGIRVASLEGLIGLNLEAGQDGTSSMLADECLQLLQNRQEDGAPISDILYSRGKAIKILVDIVLGDIRSAKLCFGECEDCELKDGRDRSGNVALSCGEFMHAMGNHSMAMDFYERALQISEIKDVSVNSNLAAATMVPEEVLLGATCALGQLLAHSAMFQDAEDMLTRALNKAEELYGSNHPKVGVILTCIAIMYGRKAKIERSSSLLIQEGLYRRAIDLLKAPSLDDEGAAMQVNRRDIVTLARGGYAEILCIQQNRKEEGERLRKWAENAWGDRRLSLAEALEISGPFNPSVVVDTRVCRVLYIDHQ